MNSRKKERLTLFFEKNFQACSHERKLDLKINLKIERNFPETGIFAFGPVCYCTYLVSYLQAFKMAWTPSCRLVLCLMVFWGQIQNYMMRINLSILIGCFPTSFGVILHFLTICRIEKFKYFSIRSLHFIKLTFIR